VGVVMRRLDVGLKSGRHAQVPRSLAQNVNGVVVVHHEQALEAGPGEGWAVLACQESVKASRGRQGSPRWWQIAAAKVALLRIRDGRVDFGFTRRQRGVVAAKWPLTACGSVGRAMRTLMSSGCS
jgi:hypothetical protein